MSTALPPGTVITYPTQTAGKPRRFVTEPAIAIDEHGQVTTGSGERVALGGRSTMTHQVIVPAPPGWQLCTVWDDDGTPVVEWLPVVAWRVDPSDGWTVPVVAAGRGEGTALLDPGSNEAAGDVWHSDGDPAVRDRIEAETRESCAAAVRAAARRRAAS